MTPVNHNMQGTAAAMTAENKYLRRLAIVAIALILGGCSAVADRRPVPSDPQIPAALTPVSGTYHDLVNLPAPGPSAETAKLMPAVAGKRTLDGKATAFVCSQGTCQNPTHDPAEFGRQLLSGWKR